MVKESQKVQEQLTKEEKKRNKFGESYLFEWEKSNNDTIESPLPRIYQTLHHLQSSVKKFEMPLFTLEHVFYLHQNSEIQLKSPPLFPTFHTLPHQTQLENIDLNVFGFPSKQKTNVVMVERSKFACLGLERDDLTREEELMRDKIHLKNLSSFLHQQVYINYPYQQLGNYQSHHFPLSK